MMALSYVCPRCRGPLRHSAAAAVDLDVAATSTRNFAGSSEEEWYDCTACDARYPVVLGIPDFRVTPDPWLPPEEDREKGRRLAELSSEESFEQAVRHYWAMTPETPPQLAERFTNFVLSAEDRSREWLAELEETESPAPEGAWLEIGCGTGDLLVAGAAAGHTMVGVDVAFRWLVAARKRLEQRGLNCTLVCANAEALPFADASVARVLSLGTVEHVADAAAVMADCRRVLRPAGMLCVRTVNRYAPVREPHVQLWGVGYVPRRWADAYVRWLGGTGYEHHHPLSARELHRSFIRAGLSGVRVRPARLLPSEAARLRVPPWADSVYDGARRIPVVGAGLTWVAPLLDVRGAVA